MAKKKKEIKYCTNKAVSNIGTKKAIKECFPLLRSSCHEGNPLKSGRGQTGLVSRAPTFIPAKSKKIKKKTALKK